jgi:hypothetical protein
MAVFVRSWLRFALFNLLIVAGIGVILRYKIAFSFPFFDQKHLLHGHSHFAFAGWITQALMVLLLAYLHEQAGGTVYKKYRWLLLANLVTAYGMLVSFPLQGYGFFSILFSTLSILVSYIFSILYWKDLNRLPQTAVAHRWFKAALVFNAISSLGAFFLAGMMATKNFHPHWYLGSVYFFLHFQYNGWFFFAGMGLLTHLLFPKQIWRKPLQQICTLFTAACVPAYFLSALWLPIPMWVYVLVVAAALAQALAWLRMVWLINKQRSYLTTALKGLSKWLLLLAAIALTIKFLLQLGSTIPALSTLAFGFRPIVIGYLHLVLLGVITLFLLGYLHAKRLVIISPVVNAGLMIFAAGIVMNEILLLVQGIGALYYINIPHINEGLLLVAVLMFAGLVLVNIGRQQRQNDFNHKKDSVAG